MDRLRGYYARFGEREWKRLDDSSDGALEFELTKRALRRHLVSPPASLLDLGGGPGRYALLLASMGYEVTLADLSPELLQLARRKEAEAGLSLAEVVETDARDLSRWEANHFDAALSLGPFYHLQSAADRDIAASELHRVIQPGGILFAAFMPRQALLRRTLAIDDERHRILDPVWVSRLIEGGIFDNDVPGRFDHGWGARPQDIEPFLQSHGFDMLELRSAEGAAPGLQDVVAMLDEPLREAALSVLEKQGADPSILSTANHLLYVGRRR